MERRYNISGTLFLTLFIVVNSTSLIGQVKFNQHNPYVSNSEIHHLRNMGIDLFDKAYTDVEFKKNVRLSLDYAEEYNADKAKYAALGVSSILGIMTGVAGLLIDQEQRDPVMNSNGQTVTPTSIKSQYILLGAAGGITAAFALKARKKRNESKSKYEQQLKITKEQYKLF